MAQQPTSPLTILQAAEMVRNRPPSEVTPAEAEALQSLVQRNPVCIGLLGGREAVDAFLEQVSRKATEPEPAPATPGAANETPGANQEAFTDKKSGRGRLEAALLIAAVLLVAAGVYFFLVDPEFFARLRGPSSPAKAPAEARAKSDAAGQSHNGPPVAKASPPPAKPVVVAAAPPQRVKPKISEPAAARPEPAGPTSKKTADGWEIVAESGTLVTRGYWDLADPSNPKPATAVVFGGKPIRMIAERRIDADHRWLRMELGTIEAWEPKGTLEVRVNSKPVARAQLDAAHFTMPLLASLQAYMGQTVKLELYYTPAGPTSAIHVNSLTLVPRSFRLEWTSLVPEKATAWSGAKLTTLPDQSILASGANVDVDSYFIVVKLPPGTQGIRVAPLADASLPANGPGRGAGGTFNVGRLSARPVENVPTKDRVVGRYVRVEKRNGGEPLSLAEVEVFSGGQNVALHKPATQTSVFWWAKADLAVDGNHSGDFNLRTVTHTGNEPERFWQVDLGAEYPIDRIMVWNRTDSLGRRLAGYRLVVLDAGNKPTWEYRNPNAPVARDDYGPFPLQEWKQIEMAGAYLPGQGPNAKPMLRYQGPDAISWTNENVTGPVDAAFHISGPPADKPVLLQLDHGGYMPGQNLGRFHLWSTTAAPPYEPEPPQMILPGL